MKRVAVWNSGDRWNDPDLVWGPLTETPKQSNAMSKDNMISGTISAEDKAAAIQKIKDSRDKIPDLGSPGKGEKITNVNGNARAGMDQTFVTHMQNHPELVPGYVSMTEVVNDKAYRFDLMDIQAQVLEFNDALEDTIAMASHDSYVAYLAFYTSVKAAAARGVAGADVILADLEPYFKNIGLGQAKANAAKKQKPAA